MSRGEEILRETALERGVSAETAFSRPRTQAERETRYKAAWRLATETHLPVRAMGKLLGYKDWSGVNHAIAKHAEKIGSTARTTTEARFGVAMNAIDWPKLATLLKAHMAEHNIGAGGYRRLGIGRGAWSWALRGKRVSADDFVLILAFFKIELRSVMTEKALALCDASA